MAGDQRRTGTIDIGLSSLTVFGTILGLSSEKTEIAHLFKSIGPDRIFIGISKKELKGLSAVIKGKIKGTYPSELEVIYAENLSRYGRVSTPPPAYVAAYELAKKKELKIRAIDIPEPDYTDLYVKHIGALDMIRHSRRHKRLRKKEVPGVDAYDFSMNWNKEMTKLKGFRLFEAERDSFMAEGLTKILDADKKARNYLAVLDVARFHGVMRILKK